MVLLDFACSDDDALHLTEELLFFTECKASTYSSKTDLALLIFGFWSSVSSVPQFASHLRFLGFSFWFFLNWGFGFPVALISSHWTRIEHVLPIFFVDYGDFAFSDLLLMPLCFGEINRLISVRDLYCRVC